MRILWVKAGGFLPLDSGGKIRSYNVIRQLATSHALTVFTFYPAVENDANPQLAEIVERAICRSLPVRSGRHAKDLALYAARLFSSRPHAVHKYCRQWLRNELHALLQRERFDVLVCDFLLPAAIIPWETDRPKVLFAHNVEALIYRRHLDETGNWLRKAVYWHEWRRTAKYERDSLRLCDHVLTVSQSDRDVLANIVDPDKISTVPTGVDAEYFRSETDQSNPDTIVFTGSMDWMPNEDGILFFLDQVFPVIERQRPGVKLTVVGRNPSARLLRALHGRKNASATGWVEDVRPYLEEAAVCIVPLRVGSGTRLKIFEAMSMGKAIVSTTLGAEGLDVSNNRNILIEDEPAAFASAVIRLLRNETERRQIGLAARDLVDRRFSWHAAASCFESVLLQVLSNRSHPS